MQKKYNHQPKIQNKLICLETQEKFSLQQKMLKEKNNLQKVQCLECNRFLQSIMKIKQFN